MTNLKQKINLYQEEKIFKPKINTLFIFQIWMLFFFFIMIIIGLKQWDIRLLKKNKELLEKNIQILNVQENHNKKIDHEKALEEKERVAFLKKKTENLRLLILALESIENKKKIPLSDYLSQFSLHHLQGTTLSYIHIEDEGQSLLFEGSAQKPEQVPQMIQRWKKTRPLAAIEVKNIQIDKSTGSGDLLVHFKVILN